MAQYILAIDQGTTGTTVSLVNVQGGIQVSHDQDFPQIFPKPGWVEHDMNLIWKTVEAGIQAVLARGSVKGTEIVAIGITNQRETVGAWDSTTLKPLSHAIVWQCRRTAPFCEALKKRKYEKQIKSRTGLVIDPYFSGSKIRWLLDHVAGLKAKAQMGSLRVGTMDSFIINKLSGAVTHATDVSNASRTQLMNIKTGQWDPWLLKIFGVPKEILPEIRPSSGIIAVTKNVAGLPDGIPIAGVAGDQQAALFGQGCVKAGEAKCTFGTGSFLLTNIGKKPKFSKAGLLTTVAWKLGDKGELVYALEGSVFVCGAAVQWLRDNLGFIGSAAEIEKLALSVPDTAGVEFVPALTGLGAPYWDAEARGLICGLTRGTSRAHIARATLESMALQNVEVLLAMEKDMGQKLKVMKVDGGATVNDLLMQMQSDFLGSVIDRPAQLESTTLGAAYLAGLGVGLWKLKDLDRLRKSERLFKPSMPTGKRNNRLKAWRLAVRRAQVK